MVQVAFQYNHLCDQAPRKAIWQGQRGGVGANETLVIKRGIIYLAEGTNEVTNHLHIIDRVYFMSLLIGPFCNFPL